MKMKILRGLAIFLILEVGLTHYLSSQHEFEEAWILGYLFLANFLGSLAAAYGIYRRKNWGWALGCLISAGSLAAYVWSRTSGLPGLRAEEWLYPWGVLSVVTEILFCLLVPVYAWLAKSSAPEDAAPLQRPAVWRYLLPVTALLALALVNYATFQIDARYPEADHEHVFFLWQVRLQPEISHQTFEEQYGMQVSLAAVSAMDGIVDVRMKVLDREKAEQLLEEPHFALLVGDTLIPAPHVSRHMFSNKTIIVFFPNQKRVVKKGTPVSIVFEDLRVEPVNVQ
jgi:hypothetical protein